MSLNMLKNILSNIRPEIWLTLGIVLAVYVVNKWLKRMKLPPGPVGLPVVGYLPFMTKDPHLKLTELAKKYGKVFSLRLGSQLVVILNDTESIREAFAKDELLERPPNSPFLLFGLETPFFSHNHKMWKEQRRFVVQSMKDLGLGKSKIEGHLQDEIQYFIKVLEEFKGKSIDMMKLLTPSMSNNICALVFGERYEYDSPDRKTMDYSLEEISRVLGQTNLYLFFPWIRHLPFALKFLKLDTAVTAFNSLFEIIERKIRQHRETLDPNNIRDYIDSYLLEMKIRCEKDPATTFSEGTLRGSVLNLFGAGSNTVRSTISWCLYIMAAYPEVQKKMQQEIEKVLGPSRFPQYTDQKDMPYSQAVIREILRWKTIVPLNASRYTMENVNVSGNHIPKGTPVIANFWAVHHSPKYWEHPEKFKPERFLKADGSLLKTNHFMPFSVGKRACPGETMAMMEVFLYFAAILQKFNIRFPEGFQPDFDAELGISYNLKAYEVCFKAK